jgi:hypothetical protein
MKKDNTGVLFKNARKDTEKHPDYSGSLTVNGQDYWLNAWVNEGAKGKYFSLKLKLKDPIPAEAKEVTYAAAKEAATIDSDEIPFSIAIAILSFASLSAFLYA